MPLFKIDFGYKIFVSTAKHIGNYNTFNIYIIDFRLFKQYVLFIYVRYN